MNNVFNKSTFSVGIYNTFNEEVQAMINITNFLFRSKRNTYIAATSLEWICPTLLDNHFLLYTRSHYVIIAQLLSRLGNIFFSQSFYRTFCSHFLLFLADVSVFLTHHTIWGREDFIFPQTGSNCLCMCVRGNSK